MRYLLLAILVCWTSVSQATVLFQDNFDSCATRCNAEPPYTTPPPSPPSGWNSWYGPAVSTQGGIQHYSGEISTPDRHSATGKSLKIWKYPGLWDGYNGSLNYNAPPDSSFLYMRYYLKLPVGLSVADASADTIKTWRWGTSTGEEIYLNLLAVGAGDLNRFNAKLSLNAGAWRDLLSESDTETLLWDGNWHCLEFFLDLNNNDVRFWLDDVQKYENLNFDFAPGTFTLMQHFAVGNINSLWNHTGWLAVDIDDFAIGDARIGPVVNTGAAPTISGVLPTVAMTGQTLTINGGNLSNEATNNTNWNSQFKTGTAYGFEGVTPVGDGYTMGSGGTE